MEIRPQPGPQTVFLSSRADIAIYGGAAGGGKSWALLAEPLRHINNPQFSAVIFRRESPMITNEGGLKDESMKIYPQIGAKYRETDHKWTFPQKSTIRFAHLQHEDDKLNWQGAQIPFIGFDELTHFTETQFFYMLSRNRSLSGVKPYVRATTNPDATSWVKKFIQPWIDPDHPVHAQSGEVLYMVRRENTIHWYRTFEDAAEDNADMWTDVLVPETTIKTVTFVAARIYDNKILLKENPEYLGNLMALDKVERERLLNGDWNILPDAGKVFDRSWFEIVNEAPAGRAEPIPFYLPRGQAAALAADRQSEVRFWDFAASIKTTKGSDPDWTVGLKLRRIHNKYYVMDVIRVRATPGEVKQLVRNTASQDGLYCVIRWEEEGGSSGKFASVDLIEHLAGFDARGIRPQGDKVTRARGASASAEGQNLKLVKGAWNEQFLTELHHFPDHDHDDDVDALSGSYNFLVNYASDVIVTSSPWDT
jgi:predicted phage terminase large subunit-like protein